MIVCTLLLVATACTRTEEAASPETLDQFCGRATEYLRFEPSLGRVANDPEQTQVFVSAWQDRLIVLEERAPDDIRDDITTIKGSVEELDQELEKVGYDLLALTIDQLDELDALADGEGSDADRRFRGYVDENCTAAPSALTDEELNELLGDEDVDPDDPAAVTAELEAALGVTPEVSECLAENLDSNALDELLGGVNGSGEMSEATIDALIAVIDTCGITADDLIGE